MCSAPEAECFKLEDQLSSVFSLRGKLPRVVSLPGPCYGGLLRSRETRLFGGMAIEHIYIYIYAPRSASWILTVSGKQFVLSLPEFENLKLKLHGRFWEGRKDDSERGYGKCGYNIHSTGTSKVFYFKTNAKLFQSRRLYIYISRGRIILSVRARVIEFSNYLFHRLVILVISFTSENNNEVLDAPAPVYYPDLSSSELVSEPYIGSVQSNVITGLITGITRKKFHVGGWGEGGERLKSSTSSGSSFSTHHFQFPGVIQRDESTPIDRCHPRTNQFLHHLGKESSWRSKDCNSLSARRERERGREEGRGRRGEES